MNERAATVRWLLLFDGALPKERIRRLQEEDEEPCIKKRELGKRLLDASLARGMEACRSRSLSP